MTRRRKLILFLAASACASVLVASAAIPGLDSIECAAPQYFEPTSVNTLLDNEVGMIALREQAGLALVQLQTKSAP